jgi:ribose transport system permease protein
MNFLKRIARQREFVIFLIVSGIFVFLSISSPSVFLTGGNLAALLLSLSLDFIIGVGMTSLFISGGFDMSVGSVVGFSSSMVAVFLKADIPVYISVPFALLCGTAVGVFNGFLIAKLKLSPFVATLASLNIFRGILIIITGGYNISSFPESFKRIGQGVFLGLQFPVWYAIVFLIIGQIFLKKSRFFRQNYYIGGNEKAARLSGINVDRMKIINYTLTSALAAFAGIVMCARLNSASTTGGTGMELRIITAVIIGGASLAGGEGSIIGTTLGVLLLGLISNGFVILGIDVYWQTLVTGMTLLVAVLIDTLGKIRKEKNLERQAAKTLLKD